MNLRYLHHSYYNKRSNILIHQRQIANNRLCLYIVFDDKIQSADSTNSDARKFSELKKLLFLTSSRIAGKKNYLHTIV